ncbi:MAG: SAM-dependent methyltransferase [Bacteroidetes bacterium]|nr:MAG: SAM-dependent methyltransferase [Bacteroidota bacterium]
MPDFTPEQLIEIESQLSHPTGEWGIEMGNRMNESNIPMTVNCFKALNLKPNDRVLELGHGNGGHISQLLKEAEHLKYSGIDISETMYLEALRINEEYLISNQVEFQLYDGVTIPYNTNTFSHVMTVNTIYFWSDFIGLLNEIYRCLKHGGVLAIAFGQKEYMKELPFVNDKFSLFDTVRIRKEVDTTNFKWVEILNYEDEVFSKADTPVNRKYSILQLRK